MTMKIQLCFSHNNIFLRKKKKRKEKGGWVPRFTYPSHDSVRGCLGRLTRPTQSDEWLLVNLNKGVAHGFPLVEEQLAPCF